MHDSTHMDHTRELVLFAEGNGRALSALVPDAFALQLRALWSGEARELLIFNEHRLINKFAQLKRSITPLDRELRLRFWLEYNRVMDLPRPVKMDMGYVLGRTMAKEKFYRDYITDPLNLAYLALPPVSYESALQFNLELAMAKIQNVLELGPVIKGEVNFAYIDKLTRLYESLHAKYYGTRVKAGKKRGEIADEPPPLAEETPEAKQIRLRAELEKKKAERAAAIAAESTKPVEGTV